MEGTAIDFYNQGCIIIHISCVNNFCICQLLLTQLSFAQSMRGREKMNGIMKYINRIARSNEVVYANRLRGYGITQSQHPYILLICREPGIPQEKISRKSASTKAASPARSPFWRRRA